MTRRADPDVDGPFRQVEEEAFAIADEIFRRPVTARPRAFYGAAGRLGHLLRGYLSALFRAAEKTPDSPRPACSSGCSRCCEQNVGGSVAEAFRIARYLQQRGRVTGATLADLRATAARVRSMDPLARWLERVPCPFLSAADSTCTVYPVRPQACSTHFSPSVTKCWDESGGVFLEQPVDLGIAVMFGSDAAFRGRGLDMMMVEVPSAVLRILETPRCLERWLAGERGLFAGVFDGGQDGAQFYPAALDAVLLRLGRPAAAA